MGVLFFQNFFEYYAYKQHANFFSHLVNQLVKYFFLSPEVNYGHVKTSRLQKNWICPVDFYVWDALLLLPWFLRAAEPHFLDPLKSYSFSSFKSDADSYFFLMKQACSSYCEVTQQRVALSLFN